MRPPLATRSYSKPRILGCGRCQVRFAVDVWLIVDSAERPDLWLRCLDGSIHVVACPDGHLMTLDTPLLLHDAGASRLWFCPPRKATMEEAMQIGQELVNQLNEAASSGPVGDIPTRVDLVAYRLMPLHLRGIPVPASLMTGEGPGVDPLLALLQDIARVTERADMPRRIQLCRDALHVVRRRDEGEFWAWLHVKLADGLSQNLVGDRADEIDEAIRAYKTALDVYTRTGFPEQWAAIQMGLGNAYSIRPEGDRAQNVERAREAYEEASHVCTRDRDPVGWAKVQNNLGNAWADRVVGDRAQNMERAIEAFERALEVRTRESQADGWAETMDNLGHAYADRVLKDRAQNIERAIELYKAALEVRRRESCPDEWAATQLNLANAYADRQLGVRAENIERAIEAYELAAEIYTREHAPERWAILQLDLASVLPERANGDRGENGEAAIAACKRALEVCTRQMSPLGWASIQSNLATLLRERGRGSREENLAEAIRAYEAALTVYAPDRMPNEARRVSRNLAQVHLESGDWDRAYFALLKAIAAADHLYGSAFTEEGRTAEIVENVLLYTQIVVVCLRLEPARRLEALLHAEDGRSRLFRDQLGTVAFPPPPNVPPELVQREAALLRAARNCDHVLRGLHGRVEKHDWVDEAAETRDALASLWETFVREYAASDYVALRRGETIAWNDIQQCLSANSITRTS